MSQYGEPWILKDHKDDGGCDFYEVADAGGARVSHNFPYNEHPFSREEVARIVACVNFCQEFPTEWLESYRLHKPLSESSRSVAARLLSQVPNFAGLMILQHTEPTKGGDPNGQENQTRSGNAEEEHQEKGQGR